MVDVVAAVAGEVVEQLGDVGADVVVAREDAEVLVDPRRVGVVVAGADVAVAAQLVAVVAHDEHALRVRLQPDHAVHDVDAGALELFRPVDVVGLVEAGLQLDEHGDLHAALGGADQRPDDRAVAAGPVQRHLDRLHPRVGRRLLDERLRRRGEALVRVVDHDRPVAHHRDDRALRFEPDGDPPRRDRRPRPILEVGTVEAVELPQEVEADRAAQAIHVVGVQVELAHEQLEHLVAHRVGDLEADGPVEAAAAQLHLDGFEQVVGLLLLDREVGVAGDAERRRLLDLHAGEQAVEMGDDELLGGEVATLVDRHEAREQVGHLDPGEALLAALGVADERGDGQGQVGDVRERVARIDRQRREHGEHALLVDLGHRLAVGLGEVAPAHDGDAGVGERRGERVEEHQLLPLDEAPGRLGDLGELLRRGAPVRGRLLDAGGDLILQRGDAHLEELVEVGRRDRAELGPFEQRDADLRRQVEHALVERQPAQLAIDEPVVDHLLMIARRSPECPDRTTVAGVRATPSRGRRGPTRG